MSALKLLFHKLIFQPLYNGLIALYLIIPDLGVVIILLTVIIRFLFLPLSKKSITAQKKMQELQPELKKIQEKYKHDKQLQGRKVMEFYQKKGVNPAGGCLPMIVQLVFFIALYRVFMLGLDSQSAADLIYPFLPQPEKLNPIAFGFLDLSKPNVWLAIVTAAVQYIQGKMMLDTKKEDKKQQKQQKQELNKEDFGSMMQKQMVYMGPAITLFIGLKFPAGLLLYWLVTNVFMVVQQKFIFQQEEAQTAKK